MSVLPFEAADCKLLWHAMGEHGRAPLPRLGRTKEQKELYCLRRYLFSMARASRLSFPLRVAKSEAPDFIVSGAKDFGIEVTEATDEADQREWTRAAQLGRSSWLNGDLGGRGRDGFVGQEPERLWSQYVLTAVLKKASKQYSTPTASLLIYSNSNAGGFIDDEKAGALFSALPESKGFSRFEEVVIIRRSCLLIRSSGAVQTLEMNGSD